MIRLRVKELAEQQGLNITTLSRKAELSYSTVHMLWHNKMSLLATATLERVAQALDVHVSDIFGEADGQPALPGAAGHEAETGQPLLGANC